ncbi:amino acid adenylation domain-containing protein [Actinoplanes sp. NPDC051346]|uniref:amino acid adenylation domain-containing protein n=1 Tax=Actinoplanes sp. NPDC051346 TaxID=3155048 RepID=UPI003431155A
MYTLSAEQRRIAVLRETQPGNPVLVLSELVTVAGPMNREALTAALSALTARHEALRTVFPASDGKTHATVQDRVEPSISHLPADGRDLLDWARDESRKPFDPRSGPPWRLLIRSSGPVEHALLLCADRIVADRASLRLMLHELGAFYAAEVSGMPQEVRPAIGYSSLVTAEQDRLADPGTLAALEAQARDLSAVPAGLDLPVDRLRAPTLTFTGEQVRITLPRQTARQATKLAQRTDLTLEDVLLANLALLLYRCCGTEDVVIGLPRRQSSAVVGPVSDLRPLHLRISGDLSFRDLLGELRDWGRSAVEHDDVPFGVLAERLDPTWDQSRRPICPVAFETRPPAELVLPDARTVAVPFSTGTSTHDLSLIVEPGAEKTSLCFEYDTDLFDPATIRGLAESFLVLLADACADPSAALAGLRLLDAARLRQVLAVSAGPEVSVTPSGAVHELVTGQAARRPNATALVAGGERVSYAELVRRANQLANHLRELGVTRGSRVGVCLNRSVDMVVAALGVLKAGGATVLLDPVQPTRRLAAMLDDAQPVVLLTAADILPNVPGDYAGTIRCVDRDRQLIAGGGDTEPPRWSHPAAACQIAYTSGSSGDPKGVVFRHDAIRRVAHATQLTYSLTAADQGSWISAPGFGISFANELWPFLTIGATVHIAEQHVVDSPFRLRDWLVDSGVTVTVLAKALAERVCATDWPDETALRVLMVSGERSGWLPSTVPFEVVVIYGSTETTNATTCLDESSGWRVTPRSVPPRQRRGSTAPVGRPVPHARVYILDERLQIVPDNVIGQLHVGGDLVQDSYLHRPGNTATKWLPDPHAGRPGARMVATGDQARRRPDGTIEILGRTDEQISLNGYRIELGEITSRLSAHPAVKQATVQVIEPEPGKKQLVAYVVPEPNRRPTSADLRETLREELPAYMVPSVVMSLEALPMLPNGKVNRRALPVPGAGREVEARYLAPRDDIEEQLVRLWSDVLRHERVGVRDDYFELGGDSLTGMELMAAVSSAFGVTLPLRSLFETSTVEQMAVLVARAVDDPRGGEDDRALTTITVDEENRYEPFPLTDIQHAYWVGRIGGLELGDVGCHGYQEWDVEGLDVARLTTAIDRLVRRHDMLRAVIGRDGRQRVLPEVRPYEVPVVDLRRAEPEQRRLRLAEQREQLSHEVMQPDVWPLFQVRVTRISDAVSRVHVSFDLLIFDARSARVFTQELAGFYRDPDLRLPPLELSFRDYVLAERAEQQASPAHAAAVDYWHDRIDELPPAPELPYLRGLTTVADPRFVRHAGSLEPDKWRRLRQTAARYGITPSALLLAVYAEVLATWSTGRRFTINLTLFNRPPLHAQLNDILGDFTSGLLLAVDGASDTFADRARAVQEQLWRDLEHRSVSSVQVMRELNRRHGAEAPRAAMPVVFSSLVGVPRMEWGNLGEYEYGVTQTPQVALDHQVMEVDGRLDYAWDAVTELFPENLVGEMADAGGRLLHRLATDDGAWQQRRPVALPRAQEEARRRANSVSAPEPAGLLHEPVLHQFAADPDAAAVITGEGADAVVVTRGVLDRTSAAVARLLADEGLAESNRLTAVLMRKGWEQVAAVLAVMRAGGAYLPIDPDLPAERIRYLTANAQVRAVLVQPGADTSALPDDVRVIAVHEDLPAPASPLPPCPAKPDDLAYVIYTSGSTGEPKGVMIEHRAALNTVVDINERLAVQPSDRVLAVSALGFDLSVWDIFGALGAGAALVMPPAADNPEPGQWLRLLAAHRVSVWNSAPALLQILVEYARGRGERLPDSLRWVLLSGDWIPLSMHDQLGELAPGAKPVSLGGATEASIWSIWHDVGPATPDWVSVPYGRPLTNQRWHVLDDDLEPRPDWVTGALFIAGTGLARGYWRDPRKTGERFIVHPRTGERLYRTGDLGRYRPGAVLEILGREDFQVKILGQRVELGEIDTALESHPGVAAACVVAVGEKRSSLRLVAHVVPATDPSPTAAELREYLAGKLHANIIPARYQSLSALPLTSNGKVDRAALTALGDGPAAVDDPGAGQQEPRTETEALLRGLAADVLGGVPVGPDDNFFSLGGDSLRAIVLINAAAEAGVDVPVELFFQHPRMRALAGHLAESATDTDPDVVDLRGASS